MVGETQSERRVEPADDAEGVDPEGLPPDGVFWVGPALIPLSAEQVLRAFEQGRLSGDAPVRIQRDAEPRPLARYVRELVWIAHRRHSSINVERGNRSLFQAAFEGAPIGMVVSDLAGRILQANEAFSRMLDYEQEDLQGMRVGELSDAKDSDRELALGNELIAGARNSFQVDKRFRARDGRFVETLTAVAVVRGEDGAPMQVIAHVLDTSALRQLERKNLSIREARETLDVLNSELERLVQARTGALRASEERFVRLFRQAPQAMLMVDDAGRVEQSNHNAQALFGYDDEELVGLPLATLLVHSGPEPNGPSLPSLLEQIRDSLVASPRVTEGVRRDGGTFSAEVGLASIDVGGERFVLVGVVDVSQRLLAQDALARSLREKETLLKEIHHRVKNNMQIISSLLSLESARLGTADARLPLEESVHRVRSMALVHEQLYGVESLERIDLGDYARRLAAFLGTAFAAGARLEVRSPSPVEVTVELAVPLGLILNELITNACKYGLPDSTAEPAAIPGRSEVGYDILIEVESEGESVRISVADSGPGLPEGFDIAGGTSLGLKLVRSLTRQIRGTLTVEREGGARFMLVCPRPKR